MGNTPNIRFKGFTDYWEQRKLGEVSDVRDGTHDSPKYQSIGHPFVTSKNVKNGYITYDDIQYISDEDFAEINKRSKVDINDILMGMIGTIGNMALIRTEPDFAIKNVALIKDTKQINYLYLYHLLQSPFIEKQLTSGMDGGTQKFVSLGNVRNLNVIYPSDIEQDKIGCYFEKLDHLITLHQRKCDETKKLKKFMLQKMFPKKDAKKPEIRFAGFTDDWEQRKLIDYLEVSSEKNRDNRFTKDDVLSVSGEYGIVNQIEFQGRSFAGASVSNYGVVENGDVVYTKSPLKSNPYGIIKTNKGIPGIVSTLYAVYKPKEITDSKFVQIYFELDSRMNSYMHPLVNKGAKNDMKVSAENALKGMVSFPKKDEQEMISLYFSSLDNLIALHQRKCDELKKFKKYMLQNMFPQKG